MSDYRQLAKCADALWLSQYNFGIYIYIHDKKHRTTQTV